MAEAQPTIYDVAQSAGVSIATVSRALNDQSSVRPATREKVLRAMRELQFVPSSVARGLSSGKHWVLGLVFVHSPVTNSVDAVEEASLLYTDIVIRGAEARAAHHGYSLLLSGAGNGRPAGMEPLLALSGSVDGLILMDRVLREENVSDLARRLPVVLLAGRGESNGAITVRTDNEGAIRALVDHLVDEHGVRSAGFVAGLDESPDSAARLRTFRDASDARGVAVRERNVLRGDWTSAGGERAMRARLSRGGSLPEVLVCANDQMAVGVIHALSASGYEVPRDVAVTGFDDISLTRYFRPSLTTIRQSGARLGEAAVDSLVAALDGTPPASTTVVLETELVVRESCGCAVPSTSSALATSGLVGARDGDGG